MRVNPVSNINFRKVYAVSGDKSQMMQLYNGVLAGQKQDEEKALMEFATDIYKYHRGNGFCANAVKNGKELAFVITGKNVDDVMFMKHGWCSLNGISQHITDTFEVKDPKEAIDYFRNRADEDWANDYPNKEN